MSTLGRRCWSSDKDQALSSMASTKVPNFVDRSPSVSVSFSQATTSNTFGLPKTREIPPSLKSSAVDSETQDNSSLSASAGPSCARPTNARSEEPPQTRMTETTVVKTPSGESAKMTLSTRCMDSDKNCFVSLSPKRVIKGACNQIMHQYTFFNFYVSSQLFTRVS
jgi:hypothetical protein